MVRALDLQSTGRSFDSRPLQSHIFETVVPTGPITMLQLLIGLIQSRDNRGRHVLSSETTDVDGYENG